MSDDFHKLVSEVMGVVKTFVYSLDVNTGYYNFLSSAVTDLTGYTEQELNSEPFFVRRVIHPDFHEYFQDTWADVLAGNGADSHKYKIITKSGEERWLLQKNRYTYDSEGALSTIEGVVYDVSADTEYLNIKEQNEMLMSERIDQLIAERVALESRIMDQQKFAELGTILTIICHELQQPITAVSMDMQYLSDLLRDRIVNRQEANECVERVEDSVGYLMDTIDTFLHYYKTEETYEEFDLVEELVYIVKLLKPLFRRYVVEVRLRCESGGESHDIFLTEDTKSVPSIAFNGSRNYVRHIFMNLLSNSLKAIEMNQREESLIDMLQISIISEPGKVVIEISDTGGGVEPGMEREIFKPDFTKFAKGTGIGLSMVYNIIVNKFKGKISCQNIENGLSVRLEIPNK